jgi:hypothetical protein
LELEDGDEFGVEEGGKGEGGGNADCAEEAGEGWEGGFWVRSEKAGEVEE